MKLKGFWKLAQFLTFIALLRCAFYHAQCGHKGRENPDIVNSQSLTGCSQGRAAHYQNLCIWLWFSNLRCAFHHAQWGHKGRENPDMVNSQSLTGCKSGPSRTLSESLYFTPIFKLTFIALLRSVFYHAQCGHKGRVNLDIENSQSLTGCSQGRVAHCQNFCIWLRFSNQDLVEDLAKTFIQGFIYLLQ